MPRFKLRQLFVLHASWWPLSKNFKHVSVLLKHDPCLILARHKDKGHSSDANIFELELKTLYTIELFVLDCFLFPTMPFFAGPPSHFDSWRPVDCRRCALSVSVVATVFACARVRACRQPSLSWMCTVAECACVFVFMPTCCLRRFMC